jgi:WhiB family redox-sensing transcriptional regulator
VTYDFDTLDDWWPTHTDNGRTGVPNAQPAPPGFDYDPRPWIDEALCATTDPEAFFPEKGGSTREAKRICMRCPVRIPCLEDALATDERFGIRGGLSERERRKLKGHHYTSQQLSEIRPARVS